MVIFSSPRVGQAIQAAASRDAITYTLAFLAQVLAYTGVTNLPTQRLAEQTWFPLCRILDVFPMGEGMSDFDLTDLVHDEDMDTCTLHVEFEGMRFKVTVEMEDWID